MEVEEQLKQLQSRLQEEQARLLGVGGADAAREEDLRAEMLEVLSSAAQHRNEVRYLEQQEERCRDGRRNSARNRAGEG